MLKRDEQQQPNSCFNRAQDTEMVFVLLARDPCASKAIRAWVDCRIKAGKNKRGDQQIIEALECANAMDRQRACMFNKGKS